ncbi:MAG: IclR family transcriptional regulator [Moorellales bacterium]
MHSVDNALQILELLAEPDKECTAGELAAQLGLSRTTAFRLLATLELHGFVRQNPASGRYRLGLKLLQLGGVVLKSLRLNDEARPILRDLVAQCGETVHLAVLDAGELVFIEKIESPRPFRMGSYVGARMPAYCTATGKLLLAYLPEDELVRYLRTTELKRYTARTITDPRDLALHLATIRAEGIAVDLEESEEGLMCIAAPIWSASGKRVLAAVSISGPVTRLKPRQEELAERVREAGLKISQAMGYGRAAPGFLSARSREG